jgi:hypothetical protein
MGRLGVLLQWNEEDTPNDAERARDAGVKALQGNSNSFFAEPQLANALCIPSPILLLEGESVLVGRGPPPSDVKTILQSSASPTGPWTDSAVGLVGSQMFLRQKVVLKPGHLDGRP